MAPRTLFVSNFPFTTSDAELRTLFEPHCTVRSIRIITDRDTGRSRGFAFVEVQTDAEADSAISGLHDTTLGGRRLVVSLARGRAGTSGEKAPNAQASSPPAEPFRHRIVIEWNESEGQYRAEVPALGVSAQAGTIADAIAQVRTLTRARSVAAGAGDR